MGWHCGCHLYHTGAESCNKDEWIPKKQLDDARLDARSTQEECLMKENAESRIVPFQ